MIKLLAPAIAIFLLLGTGSVNANEEFNAAWDAADARRMDAAAVEYEWRDTGKILKKAKAAAEEGDIEAAMKLVAKAHEQSEDAIAQQAREAGLWQARVPQ
jgi:hypothetical protein